MLRGMISSEVAAKLSGTTVSASPEAAKLGTARATKIMHAKRACQHEGHGEESASEGEKTICFASAKGSK